jgi:hypothetical protein
MRRSAISRWPGILLDEFVSQVRFTRTDGNSLESKLLAALKPLYHLRQSSDDEGIS